MSEPKSTTCTRLSQVVGISHDSVNRFLLRESYEPKNLFNEAQGRSLPKNYRVYDKADNKIKNDYFQDMLAGILAWELRPAFATGDSWYSCEKNLKTVKNHLMGSMFAVEANHTVSVKKGAWVQVQRLYGPAQGLMAWLRISESVKLFRTRLKDQLRHCVTCLPDAQGYNTSRSLTFQKLHDQHWGIEHYHCLLKQFCNVERFQMRGKVPALNHLFTSLCSFVQLQEMRLTYAVVNAYQWKAQLFTSVVTTFVSGFIRGKEPLNLQFNAAVNV